MSTNDTDWSGIIYSGMCWNIHSFDIFPYSSTLDIGLANALFGCFALITFCIILYVVYVKNRRERKNAATAATNKNKQQQSSTSNEEKSIDDTTENSVRARALSGSWLAMTFTPFSGSGSSNSVSFSSYVKFLNVSGFWALLWCIYCLMPTIGSGRQY